MIKMKTKLEYAYAEILDKMRLAGEIVNWYYEPFNIRLADNTFWKPDFLLVFPDRFEFHETKGWWRRDARAKIKIAAKIYPYFKFVGVQLENKQWKFEKFN